MSTPYLKAISFCSSDSVILLRKNNSDRKFLCNFFARNCLYKTFDVRTTDHLILFINSKSITLKSFIERLLSKILTSCNFPSIVVMLLQISTSTSNYSQPRDAVIFSWKSEASFELPYYLRWECTEQLNQGQAITKILILFDFPTPKHKKDF